MPINRRGEMGGEGRDPFPEQDPKNPYLAAGFKTGDLVIYRPSVGDQGGDLATLEITGPTTDRPNGGAWLIGEGGRRITNIPSESPERCQRYSFPSETRAIEAYKEELPKINSKKELFLFFYVLERSGVQPNHKELGIAQTWDQARNMYNSAEAKFMQGTPVTLKELPGTGLLKINLLRILEHEIPNRALKSFRAMKVGDQIQINWIIYVKVGPDAFQTHNPNRKQTSLVTMPISTAEVERMVRQTQENNILIIPAKKNFAAETSRAKPEVSENFKRLLPELYAKRTGIYNKAADLLAKAVGRGRPASYDEVLKYLPHSEISQGFIGDCYLVAGINSLKKTHPELYLSVLSKSLRKGQNPGEWQVKFQGLDLPQMQADLGDHFDGWITITEQSLNIWAVQGMNADLPDVILERAYASYISRKERKKIGMTMHRDRMLGIKMAGGFGHRALYDILGPEAASKKMIANYEAGDGYKTLKENLNADTARHFLRHTFANNPERYVVTANTPYKGLLRVLSRIGGHVFYSPHAYSVIKVEGDRVHIENPHDSSKPIWLSVDNFVDAFSQISYVEIKS